MAWATIGMKSPVEGTGMFAAALFPFLIAAQAPFEPIFGPLEKIAFCEESDWAGTDCPQLENDPPSDLTNSRDGDHDVFPIWFRGRWATDLNKCASEPKNAANITRTRIEVPEDEDALLLKATKMFAEIQPDGSKTHSIRALIVVSREDRDHDTEFTEKEIRLTRLRNVLEFAVEDERVDRLFRCPIGP